MIDLSFKLNQRMETINIDPDTPLLWVLRDHFGLTGTKYSCGMGICGSCTVHIDGKPEQSCRIPISQIAGKHVLTIEGLAIDGLHPVQKAWVDEEVSQCGYCQSGQIMTAVDLLNKKPHPSDEDIDVAMNRNLCRCGTYQRIRKAIHKAAEEV